MMDGQMDGGDCITCLANVVCNNTLFLNKKPRTVFAVTIEQALLDFNNFWRKCFLENVQFEDGIFSLLT